MHFLTAEGREIALTYDRANDKSGFLTTYFRSLIGKNNAVRFNLKRSSECSSNYHMKHFRTCRGAKIVEIPATTAIVAKNVQNKDKINGLNSIYFILHDSFMIKI